MTAILRIPAMGIAFAGLPDSISDDDEWWAHVQASELYNQAVSKAHIGSYFHTASIKALGRDVPSGLAYPDYDFDYILPGDRPTDEDTRLAYETLHHALKQWMAMNTLRRAAHCEAQDVSKLVAADWTE